MQKTEIIRAYMLEPGDRFIKLGIKYKVISTTNKKIICGYLYGHHNVNQLSEIGSNSQERIELICDEDKPGTSGQLVINFKPNKFLNHGINLENRNDQTN